MTGEDLIAAGFTKFAPSHYSSQSISRIYQKSISDSDGRRYFITVSEFDPVVTEHDTEVCGRKFEADIYYNQGFVFFPSQAATKIEIYGKELNSWTPEELIEAADSLWERLHPVYYETWKPAIEQS